MVDIEMAETKKVTFDEALGNKGLEEPATTCQICVNLQEDIGTKDTFINSLRKLCREKRNFCIFIIIFLLIGYLLAKANTVFE